MKTKTLILAVLVLGIFSTSSIYAESVSNKQSSDKQLTDTIESQFQNFPLQDLMVYRERSNVKVEFEINSYNELSNIHINGSNSDLVNYVAEQLTQAPIKVSPNFEHKKYSVNILCILR